MLCNLDKLVVGLLQNLYRASADKVFHKLTQLYYYEQTTQSEGISPAIYRGHAQALLCRSDKEVKPICVRSSSCPSLTTTCLTVQQTKLSCTPNRYCGCMFEWQNCQLTGVRACMAFVQQVVRVQYHPGAHKAAGGWLVEPELKMEFIGRMGTEGREEGAAVDTDSTHDGIAQNDATMAVDD